MGAFEKYMLSFVFLVFAAGMILNFSGSIFNAYDANVSSDSLKKIKDSAEDVQPGVSTQRNRTTGISPEESTFLSPQGFGVISDVIGSAGNFFKLVQTFTTELGLPGGIVGLIVGIVTLKLVWEGLSALFGWDL